MDGDIVAVGGDLEWQRVIKGFEKSCFPLFGAQEEIKWWSPERRAVFFPHLHAGFDSILEKLQSKGIEFRWDKQFDLTMQHCSRAREAENPWLHRDTLQLYHDLHIQGFAHSLEVYQNGELIGGLMGVALGRVFFGLSMFHLKSNGSKWALMYLIQFLKSKKFKLLDAQQSTPFLTQMGAVEIQRDLFLDKMREMYKFGTARGDWSLLRTWSFKDPFPKHVEFPENWAVA